MNAAVLQLNFCRDEISAVSPQLGNIRSYDQGDIVAGAAREKLADLKVVPHVFRCMIVRGTDQHIVNTFVSHAFSQQTDPLSYVHLKFSFI